MLLQQCHPNSAGSLVIARRTERNPQCFCCFFCVVGYPPNWGKRPRYIDRSYCLMLIKLLSYAYQITVLCFPSYCLMLIKLPSYAYQVTVLCLPSYCLMLIKLLTRKTTSHLKLTVTLKVVLVLVGVLKQHLLLARAISWIGPQYCQLTDTKITKSPPIDIKI